MGTETPADILTKYLDHATMAKALKTMNCEFREGRAKATPDKMGQKKRDNLTDCGFEMAEGTHLEEDRLSHTNL